MGRERSRRNLPNVDEILAIVSYDPETGKFLYVRDRLGRHRKRAGEEAGGYSAGYVLISINGDVFSAHRLAWKIMTGRDPKEIVDHIDGNRSNNAWSNLREATHAENSRNRKPNRNSNVGKKGVSFHPETGTYLVNIRVSGFTTIQSAADAYDKCAKILFGDFARTNADNDNYEARMVLAL
ncbi:HNH endonuclease [Bosea sp. LjRoot237]|uniref:HNH endonuclease n=1 Tax=Bosea sp. LjRoot237 TaxID=3342292 RepID=UPI003ECE5853